MNASSTLKAELDVMWWSTFAAYVAIWHERNPNGSATDLVDQVERQAAHLATVAVEAEVEAGATAAEAAFIVQSLSSHRREAEVLLN
ncbi:hypothetical protein ABZ593_05820 [Streptomyces sp. NPDC012617]|uniref:hypothetical protein n=1 Tax=Streptomyces TaxID=1883 RepID=UPI0033E6403A